MTKANASSPDKHELLSGVHPTRGTDEKQETSPDRASSSEEEPLSTIGVGKNSIIIVDL